MEKYLLVLITLIASSYVYLRLAIRFKIIDKPNERSSHRKITVRGGGIIFSTAILLFFFLNDFEYPFFTLGVFLISIISFVDDIITLSSKIRLPFQLFAVFLVLYQVGLPFIPIYIFIFYLLFGTGIVNMFNFMDGINGITGLYTLSVVSGLYFINNVEQVINPDLIIYVTFSVIVFGFYNFRKKALFFAGDIGSITIGLFMFFIGFYLTFKLNSPLILLLVIVYGADAGNTILYRKLFTKESILDPHRHHIYQKLIDIKRISHIKVSIIYASIQILVNIIIYKTYRLDIQAQIFIFVCLVVLFIAFYVYLFKKLKAAD